MKDVIERWRQETEESSEVEFLSAGLRHQFGKTSSITLIALLHNLLNPIPKMLQNTLSGAKKHLAVGLLF